MGGREGQRERAREMQLLITYGRYLGQLLHHSLPLHDLIYKTPATTF